MATNVLPIVRVGDTIGEIQPGQVLDGNCTDIPLVARQAGSALTLLSTDALIDGSNYLWEKQLLPVGRLPYFEIVASGVNLGAAVGVTVGLYTLAGVLVANSSLTVTSITSLRARSVALTLVDATEYVVKYKTGGLIGSAFVYSARILLR